MAEKVAYSPFCWIINDDALAASEDAGNARDARAFELKWWAKCHITISFITMKKKKGYIFAFSNSWAYKFWDSAAGVVANFE